MWPTETKYQSVEPADEYDDLVAESNRLRDQLSSMHALIASTEDLVAFGRLDERFGEVGRQINEYCARNS